MVYNNDFLFLMNDLFTYNNFFIKFSIMNKNKLWDFSPILRLRKGTQH